jgi:hypothetical protein
VAFDIGQLGLQERTQAFGGAGGGGFAGGAGGGGGGRFNKPSLGIALVVEAPTGKADVLAEISPLATAVDDQGRTLKTEQTGPAHIHFQEFEHTVPGGQPIYFAGAAKDIKAIQKLEGELLLSPGRVLEARFEGGKFNARMTKRVNGASFVLESVAQNADGIQLSVVCPLTKAQAEAAGPQERFQAMLAARGAYAAEIEDNTGEIHRSQSGNSAGGGGGGIGFGGGGIGVGGPPPRGGQANPGSSQTFRFAPLPDGRQIATIRVRMTERIGPAKAVPFAIENISVR